MNTPLFHFLSSLEGRFRSGRVRFSIPGSRSVLALASVFRQTGSLVGIRRCPRNRLELLARPGLPPPSPLPRGSRSRRALVSLSPSALLASSLGPRSAAQLRRDRRGGIPLLLPFGR